MNKTLEFIVKTSGLVHDGYHNGDTLTVYDTETLADFVDGEFRFRESIINSPFHYAHVTDIPNGANIDRITEEYRVNNGSPILQEVEENPTVRYRRRKWFIDHTKIGQAAKDKLLSQKEITATFTQLKNVLAKKSVPSRFDMNQDGIADYLQDSDI